MFFSFFSYKLKVTEARRIVKGGGFGMLLPSLPGKADFKARKRSIPLFAECETIFVAKNKKKAMGDYEYVNYHTSVWTGRGGGQ